MKEQKTRHLEFVLLTPAEHIKLCDLLGADGTAHWIDELNDYLGLSEKNRKKYDSHYHAIRRWSKKASAGTGKQGPAGDLKRAADHFVSNLKEFSTWPIMSPTYRQIVYAVLLKRQQTWPNLRKALIEDPTIADQLREAFLAEAQRAQSKA